MISQTARTRIPSSPATRSRAPTYLKTSNCQRGIGRTRRSSSVPFRTMLGTKAAVTATLTRRRIVPPRPVARSFWRIRTSSPSGAPFVPASSTLSPKRLKRWGQRSRRSRPGATVISHVCDPIFRAHSVPVSRISVIVQSWPSAILPNRAVISSPDSGPPTSGMNVRVSVAFQWPSGRSASRGSAALIAYTEPLSRPATSPIDCVAMSMPSRSAASARAAMSRYCRPPGCGSIRPVSAAPKRSAIASNRR